MTTKEELKQAVCEAIDRHGNRIIELGETILHHPETGFNEQKTAALVADAMRAIGLEPAPARFLASLTYRDGPSGPPVFHTFAFLLEDITGAAVRSLDLHEQIESYIEVPVGELARVADRLDEIPADGAPGIANWDAWGRFRGHVHRAVHEALS